MKEADLTITEEEKALLRALDKTVNENLKIFPKPGQFHEARHARELLTWIRLTRTLQEHQATTHRQTKVMIGLTRALVIFTIFVAAATFALVFRL